MRAVGSYQTAASAPYDLSYLYDGAAAPGQQITSLAYPNPAGEQTLFTIAHSTFGHQAVGDYDTDLATGNAFIYDISTGTFTTNNIPGAISTTAYGIYGDKIAGGYAKAAIGGGLGPQHGYIYDQITGTYETYDHPGAIGTHFEGITGGWPDRRIQSRHQLDFRRWRGASGGHACRRPRHRDLVRNRHPRRRSSPPIRHMATRSSASMSPNGVTNGYVATIPGMYNPIRNTGTLTSSADNAAALSGGKGDDIVNSGAVEVTGTGGVGMRGETYGVLTNSGTVVATGLGWRGGGDAWAYTAPC